MKSHNDRSECKRRKIKYNSPYHLGCMKNWKALLGFSDGWSFLRHVVLPSKNRGSFYSENVRFTEIDEERLL